MEVHELLQFITGPSAYPIFFLLMMLCGLGMPLNSDLLMLGIGALSGTHASLDPFILVGVAIAGINTGDTISFTVGQKAGMRLLRIWPFYIFFKIRRIRKTRRFLQNQGVRLIFLVRFIPGMRSVTIFTAGLFKMKYLEFIKINFLAVSIVASGYIYGGRRFLSSYEQARDNLPYLLILAVIAALFIAMSRMIQKPKSFAVYKIESIDTLSRGPKN